MTDEKNPGSRDAKIMAALLQKLEDLPTYSFELNIDQILVMNSDFCMRYITADIKEAFLESEKLPLVPPQLIAPINDKAAAVFIQRNQVLNENIKKHYKLVTAIH